MGKLRDDEKKVSAEEFRRRREADDHKVLPDGTYEYKGDAYYGYDKSTEPRRWTDEELRERNLDPRGEDSRGE
jgi:hypothetical protein